MTETYLRENVSLVKLYRKDIKGEKMFEKYHCSGHPDWVDDRGLGDADWVGDRWDD